MQLTGNKIVSKLRRNGVRFGTFKCLNQIAKRKYFPLTFNREEREKLSYILTDPAVQSAWQAVESIAKLRIEKVEIIKDLDLALSELLSTPPSDMWWLTPNALLVAQRLTFDQRQFLLLLRNYDVPDFIDQWLYHIQRLCCAL